MVVEVRRWVVSGTSIKTPRRKKVGLQHQPGPESIKPSNSRDIKSKLSSSPIFPSQHRGLGEALGWEEKGNTREGANQTPSPYVLAVDPPPTKCCSNKIS